MEILQPLEHSKPNKFSIDNKRFALIDYKCGEFYFSSNFDSGNLGRVELCKHHAGVDLPDNAISAHFNVWTVPDCYGTSNETPNRTWFYFSIRGGSLHQSVKINVKNLNRQSKLFSHGMTPVTKVGINGTWHRIKGAPTYQNEEEHFVISFVHKVQNHPEIEIFYAFTYPFSYFDCLKMLNKFDEKYLKSKEEIDVILKQIYKKTPIEQILPNIESLVKKQFAAINLPCYSLNVSYIKDFETLARKELQNEIYYYREVLIKSIEGRRVDLITITSFHGIQDALEKKIDNLFPEEKPRCNAFENKKVIFLSSRVHPGETPASFVLNGFLNMILDRKNPVSIALRRIYVFKIVPILNPDGVYHGFYRTDTLGQNLNRMYLETSLEYHPSIYAVKKLINFYQHNSTSHDEIFYDIDKSLCYKSNEESDFLKENINIGLTDVIAKDENFGKLLSINISESRNESINYTETFNIETTSELKQMNNEGSKRAGEDDLSSSVSSVVTSSKKQLGKLNLKKNSEPKISRNASIKTITCASNMYRNTENNLKDSTIQARTTLKKGYKRMDCKLNSTSSNSDNTIICCKKVSKTLDNLKNKMQIKPVNYSNEPNSYTSMSQSYEENNLFLYIDMHGHASKKGVFMYGNHFSNLGQAIECMLLPKIMTINSQHFHFDACNFSEKNMYKKEKRDGLSKEGSGRVTAYKMTGLVKCYTLECNYNCGKYVNSLPSKTNVYSKQIMSSVPPKYTPATYEEVGRALGPSILDLTNSNPASRLPNSEYRSLQGLRSSLRYTVDKSVSSHNRSHTSNVTSKISAKRQTIDSPAFSSSMLISSKKKDSTKVKYKEISSQRWNAGNDTSACSTSHKIGFLSPHLKQHSQIEPCQYKTKNETLLTKTKVAETCLVSHDLSKSPPTTKISLSTPTFIARTLKPNSFKVRSTCLYGKKDFFAKKKAKALAESPNSVIGTGSGPLPKCLAVKSKHLAFHSSDISKSGACTSLPLDHANPSPRSVPNNKAKEKLEYFSKSKSNFLSLSSKTKDLKKQCHPKHYFKIRKNFHYKPKQNTNKAVLKKNSNKQNNIISNVKYCCSNRANKITDLSESKDSMISVSKCPIDEILPLLSQTLSDTKTFHRTGRNFDVPSKQENSTVKQSEFYIREFPERASITFKCKKIKRSKSTSSISWRTDNKDKQIYRTNSTPNITYNDNYILKTSTLKNTVSMKTEKSDSNTLDLNLVISKEKTISNNLSTVFNNRYVHSCKRGNKQEVTVDKIADIKSVKQEKLKTLSSTNQTSLLPNCKIKSPNSESILFNKNTKAISKKNRDVFRSIKTTLRKYSNCSLSTQTVANNIRSSCSSLLSSTPAQKKRTRGFDSVTVKHKKNKIRSTKL